MSLKSSGLVYFPSVTLVKYRAQNRSTSSGINAWKIRYDYHTKENIKKVVFLVDLEKQKTCLSTISTMSIENQKLYFKHNLPFHWLVTDDNVSYNVYDRFKNWMDIGTNLTTNTIKLLWASKFCDAIEFVDYDEAIFILCFETVSKYPEQNPQKLIGFPRVQSSPTPVL